MRQRSSLLATAVSMAALLGSMVMTASAPVSAADASVIEEGKKLAFDRKMGNCLACHQIEGGELAGNIGPPLVAMKARYPDKAKLRAQIWDATEANPNTIMPPFGRHKIVSDTDVDKIVEFIYTL
jgi:sulfur-oxidizing protein SoxX